MFHATTWSRHGLLPDGLPAIAAETDGVVAGVKPDRENSEENIANSNIGVVVCDVTVGRALYDRAVAGQVGTILALWKHPAAGVRMRRTSAAAQHTTGSLTAPVSIDLPWPVRGSLR
ncbi:MULTISPECIES: hypothetical protein [Arthrobacter]|uniref:Uncharacterized protein n=1 Tax=Arthrobacter terricola TaxID=2547396 RepID=A0A4R5KCT1_9MICC|nr:MULTISPECIES: hypothetical protein [Arthrobacter]MBT8161772.1 hypothetical protein [Arthrobacter sp. GN70]TDF92662.1 hypothetical protein E1809_17570 [Arthrobacter terricola]